MDSLDLIPASLLATPFTVAQARDAGVHPQALRSRRLQRPYFAVRSRGLDLARLDQRCRAYAARMHHGAAFSHSTAAALWGMPLPRHLEDSVLHVTVPVGRRAVGGAGVVGHQQRLAEDEVSEVDGLRVVTPAAAWAQLAELVSEPDLVAAGDFLLTGLPLADLLPLATLDELAAASAVRVGGPGARKRGPALGEVRAGSFSRPESLARILLTRAGIPEPVLNSPVHDARGTFVAMPDLQWPEWRVALEYEGDHHREREAYRRDIARLERLVDAGWVVIRVSAAELFGDPRLVVTRVERRLQARGWPGHIHLRQIARFEP